jgi:hypothetical protein
MQLLLNILMWVLLEILIWTSLLLLWILVLPLVLIASVPIIILISAFSKKPIKPLFRKLIEWWTDIVPSLSLRKNSRPWKNRG